MPTSLVDVAATDPHVGFVSCGSYCRFVHLARVTHAMKLFDDEAKKCFLSFFVIGTCPLMPNYLYIS